ncbi:ATP-binding protein, partial [Streptomyces sp. NRRL F-5126]|uniref:ATP-binding protein n=1 Tax=Streptomyces sp. NRRL F-5126 TaxID=1463857 RepID=UPI0004C823B2
MAESCETRFSRAAASIGDARAFIRDALPVEQFRDRIDDITLCVSELTTNALQHGTPAGRLFLVRATLDERVLRIEVHDACESRPRLRSPDDDDMSGRGLTLVAALADGWGTAPRKGLGKIVWVEFKVPASMSVREPQPC